VPFYILGLSERNERKAKGKAKAKKKKRAKPFGLVGRTQYGKEKKPQLHRQQKPFEESISVAVTIFSIEYPPATRSQSPTPPHITQHNTAEHPPLER